MLAEGTGVGWRQGKRCPFEGAGARRVAWNHVGRGRLWFNGEIVILRTAKLTVASAPCPTPSLHSPSYGRLCKELQWPSRRTTPLTTRPGWVSSAIPARLNWDASSRPWERIADPPLPLNRKLTATVSRSPRPTSTLRSRVYVPISLPELGLPSPPPRPPRLTPPPSFLPSQVDPKFRRNARHAAMGTQRKKLFLPQSHPRELTPFLLRRCRCCQGRGHFGVGSVQSSGSSPDCVAILPSRLREPAHLRKTALHVETAERRDWTNTTLPFSQNFRGSHNGIKRQHRRTQKLSSSPLTLTLYLSLSLPLPLPVPLQPPVGTDKCPLL